MVFTIINNTGSTVGPYGGPGTTITTGNSFVVNPPAASYVNDFNLQSDILAENVLIQMNGSILPVNSALSVLIEMNLCKNLTGNATTTVKSSAGTLESVIIGNNTTGGSIVIYDNTTASGTVLMSLLAGTPSGGLLSTTGQNGPICLTDLNIEFSIGLTVITSGSSSNNVTVLYR